MVTKAKTAVQPASVESDDLGLTDAEYEAAVEHEVTEASVEPDRLVVLTDAFVARTDNDKASKATKRYSRGETFVPVEGAHDVEQLVRLKVLGRTGGEPLVASTALVLAKAAAVEAEDTSPVLDLRYMPFERSDVPDDSSTDEDVK